MAHENLRHSAEIARRILNLGAADSETARIRSQRENAQHAMNSSIPMETRANSDEQLESRGGSDTCRIRRYHSTDGCKSLRRAIRLVSANSRWKTPLKQKHKVNVVEQEKHCWSCRPGRDIAQNKLNNYQTTQSSPAAGELPSVSSVGEDPVQSKQQNSGVPKKNEADRIEFEKFPSSNTFVMHFKSEVCSSSSFPT